MEISSLNKIPRGTGSLEGTAIRTVHKEKLKIKLCRIIY